MDINPDSGADYIADLCNQNECSPASATFDVIICTEVLEHTLNPFKAVDEIFRMLKHGGIVYATTPFNFRIHGPSPDCYRFTKNGLNELFKKFEKIKINEVPTKDRPNMPIAYSIIAKK
jgi:2-polyprenyl-3-methyl-5-hydroxy-6-metoxy-1,4-benzoquinol methylase